MTTRTVVCPDCGHVSEPGSASCSACGAVFQGAISAPQVWTAPEPALEPAEAAAPEPAAPAAAAAGPAPNPSDAYAARLRSAAEQAAGSDLLGQPARPAPSEPDPSRTWPVELTVPEPHVPAGAYLPPSAVLPPLDAPAVAAAAAGGAGAAVARPGPSVTAGASDAAARLGAWFDGVTDPARRLPVSRRLIAVGSAIAALGFVLPWANVGGSALLSNWFLLWGLAGAGHWLLVLAVVALGGLAGLVVRSESWPLAVPSFGLGALLLGIVWPYVFGSLSRPFGVLVVLVGAIVLIAGGGLGVGARHEAATPDV